MRPDVAGEAVVRRRPLGRTGDAADPAEALSEQVASCPIGAPFVVGEDRVDAPVVEVAIDRHNRDTVAQDLTHVRLLLRRRRYNNPRQPLGNKQPRECRPGLTSMVYPSNCMYSPPLTRTSWLAGRPPRSGR